MDSTYFLWIMSNFLIKLKKNLISSPTLKIEWIELSFNILQFAWTLPLQDDPNFVEKLN